MIKSKRKKTKPRFFKRILLLVVMNHLFSISDTKAATIYAKSCFQHDVQTAINSAHAGDTIVIPAGECTWTSPVFVKKAIALMGGGRYATDKKRQDFGSWPLKITLNGNVGIEIQGSSNDYIRLSGFYFIGTTETGWGPNHGGAVFINPYNLSNKWRIDNCNFHNISGTTVRVSRGYGLIDNCYIYRSDCSATGCIRVSHFLDANGDSAWTFPPNFGSADFVYIEDCTFWKQCTQSSDVSPVAVDAQAGGKYVVRYCYFYDTFVSHHGTESGAPQRGGYAVEFYGNELYWSLKSDRYHAAYFARGGSMLMYDNRITNYQAAWKTWVHRAAKAWGRFGKCDGTQPHDGNWGGDYPPGYPCLDQVGRGAASGTELEDIQPQAESKCCLWNNTLVNTRPVFHNNPEYVVEGRDYEISQDESAKPDYYTPFPYPHPLILTPPLNLRFIN